MISSAGAQPKPAAARFDVTGYAVEGAPLLRSEDFSRVVAPFIGRQKSSADVQNARQLLLQAYQDLGHCAVQVVAPRAEPLEGVVTFKVRQSRSAAGKDCLPMAAFDVTPGSALAVLAVHGAVKSNSTVTPMAVPDGSGLAAALNAREPMPPLQGANTSEKSTRSKPAQLLAQAPAAVVDAVTPADSVEAAPTLKFAIDRYRVDGNTLLKTGAIAKLLQPYAGKQKDFADVQRALEALQIAYQKAGWGAVQVTLPEQELERGEVRFEVIETRVGKIEVQAGEYFNETNVRRSVPSLQAGRTPNSLAVARGLKIANENPAKQTQVS